MKLDFWVCVFFTWILVSCQKSEPPTPEIVVVEPGKTILVCHEGNFRWGNAGAGLLFPGSGKAQIDAYRLTNQDDLGDVLQSAAFWNGHWYLVVNNSGRIEQLVPGSLKKKNRITGFVSPRFLVPVSDVKAYVSDLYANGIWVLEVGNSMPSRKISMPGWTEEMVFQNGKILVQCRDAGWILVVDPVSDKITDTLKPEGKISSIAKASKGRIWIGLEPNDGKPGRISLWHPDSLTPEKSWNLGAEVSGQRFESSVSGDTLFFLWGGLCRLTAYDSGIFRYPLGPGNWYGLAYEARTRQIWVSDAKDYLQSSRIVQLESSGPVIREWTGGIISSRFYFW